MALFDFLKNRKNTIGSAISKSIGMSEKDAEENTPVVKQDTPIMEKDVLTVEEAIRKWEIWASDVATIDQAYGTKLTPIALRKTKEDAIANVKGIFNPMSKTNANVPAFFSLIWQWVDAAWAAYKNLQAPFANRNEDTKEDADKILSSINEKNTQDNIDNSTKTEYERLAIEDEKRRENYQVTLKNYQDVVAGLKKWDPEEAKQFFNKALDEYRKTQRQMNAFEVWRMWVFQVWPVFKDSVDRDTFVDKTITPIMEKYIDDPLSEDWYIKQKMAKMALSAMIPKLAKSSNKLVSAWVYDTAGDFFMNETPAWVEDTRTISPEYYISTYMGEVKKLLDKDYKKYLTEDGTAIDTKKLWADIETNEMIAGIDRSFKESIQDLTVQWWKKKTDEAGLYSKLPSFINRISAESEEFANRDKPWQAAATALREEWSGKLGKAHNIFRSIVGDYVQDNPAQIASLPIQFYAAMRSPAKIQQAFRAVPAIERAFSLAGPLNRAARIGTAWASEILWSIPLNATFNSMFIEDIDPTIDLWIDFLAWAIWTPGVSYIDNLINTVSKLPSTTEKQAYLKSKGITVPEAYVADANNIRKYMEENASMFSKWGVSEMATFAMEAMKSKVDKMDNIDDVKWIADILLTSKTFSKEQKAVNQEILNNIAKEWDISVVKRQVNDVLSNYNIDTYKEMIDAKIVGRMADKVIDTSTNNIVSMLTKAGIPEEAIPKNIIDRVTLSALMQGKDLKGNKFLWAILDIAKKTQGEEKFVQAVEENASRIQEMGKWISETGSSMKQKDFADRVIQASQKAASWSPKPVSTWGDVTEKTVKRAKQSKATEARNAMSLVDKIADKITPETMEYIKSSKGPSKIAAIKKVIGDYVAEGNPSLSAAQVKNIANYLTPGFQGKYIAEIPGYSFEDFKTSIIRDRTSTDEILNVVDDMTVPYTITDESVSGFLSDIVKKLYGSNSTLTKKLQKSLDSFVKEYDEHEIVLAKTWLDNFMKWFLAILPDNNKQKIVLWLSWDLYKSTKDLLGKKILTINDKLELQNTIWVVMHEFGHIIYNSFPEESKLIVEWSLWRAIFDDGTKVISLDGLQNMLGESIWSIKKGKYINMVKEFWQGNVTNADVVEEVFTDIFENNFKSYVANPEVYEWAIRTNIEEIVDPKTKSLYAAAMETIHDYVKDAGQYIRSIVAFAYKTSPQSADIEKTIRQLSLMTIKWDPKYLLTIDKAKVMFSADSASKVVDVDDIKEALVSSPTAIMSEFYIDSLVNGYNGIARLDDVVSTIIDAVNKWDIDMIDLPLAYSSVEWRMVLQYIFSKELQSADFMKQYEKILTNSSNKALQKQAWFGALLNKFFDPTTKKFSMSVGGINMSDFSISKEKIVSNKWSAARNSKYQWGTVFEEIPVLTKYILLSDSPESIEYVSNMISKHFSDTGESKYKDLVRSVFGNNVWAVWLDIYIGLRNKLKAFGNMSDDQIADFLHPMIFSTDEYASALAKAQSSMLLPPENMADQVLWYLFNTQRWTYANYDELAKRAESSDFGKAIRDNSLNFYEKQLSMSSFNRSSLDFVKDNKDFTFSMSPERFAEYTYKTTWDSFWDWFGRYDNVPVHFMNMVMTKAWAQSLDQDSTRAISMIMGDLANIQNRIIIEGKSVSSELTSEFENTFDILKKQVSNITAESTLDKEVIKNYVDKLYDSMKNQRTKLYDFARSELIPSIIDNTKYFPDWITKASSRAIDSVLEKSIERNEILKKMKKDESQIVANQMAEDLRNMSIEDTQLDADWMAGKTPDEIDKAKAEKYKNIVDKFKNLINDLNPKDKPFVYDKSIFNTLDSIFKGKAGTARLLYNADYVKEINSAIEKTLWNSQNLEYFYVKSWAYPDTVAKFNKQQPYAWWFNSLEVVNRLFSSDPEAGGILERMLWVRQTWDFFHTSTWRTGKGPEFFAKIADDYKEITDTMKNKEVQQVFDNFIKRKLGQEVSIEFSEQGNRLNRFLTNLFLDIEEFRGRTKLGNVQYTNFSIPENSTINKDNILNRITGMWNYVDNAGINRLVEKFWDWDGIFWSSFLNTRSFKKNILFWGVNDTTWYRNAFNDAIQRVYILSKYRWPFGTYNAIQNFLAWQVSAKAVESIYTVDTKLLNQLTKYTKDDMGYKLIWQASDEMSRNPYNEYGSSMPAWAALADKFMFHAWDWFNKGNALLISDKLLFDQALDASTKMALYDIIEAGWQQAVDDFVKQIADFKDYMSQNGIKPFNFAIWSFPGGIIKQASERRAVAEWSPKKWFGYYADGVQQYTKWNDFYKSKYEPFIVRTRNALNSFYVFDNIKELGSINAITEYPWAFWLMKWATGKSSEWISMFAHEIRDAWSMQNFLKSIVAGESKASERLLAEIINAYRIAHGMQRASGGTVDRDDIFWGLVAPLVALNMISASLIKNVAGTAKQKTEAGEPLIKSVGAWIMSWIQYGLMPRFGIYQQSLANDLARWIATSRNLDDQSSWESTKTVFNSVLYDMFTKGLMRPFTETFGWYAFDKENMNIWSLFGAITMTDPTATQVSSDYTNEAYALSSYAWDYALLDSNGLANMIPFSKLPLSIFANPQMTSPNRNILLSKITDYMDSIWLSDISNPYMQESAFANLVTKYDNNAMKVMATSEWVSSSVDSNDVFNKLVAKGALTDESPTYKLVLWSLNGTAWEGKNLGTMVFANTKEAEYINKLDIFTEVADELLAGGKNIDRDSWFIDFIKATERLGVKMTVGDLMKAYVDWVSDKYLLALAWWDKEVVSYIKSLKWSEESDAIKSAPGNDKAQSILQEYYSTMHSFQNKLIVDNRDYLAREWAFVVDFTNAYMNVDDEAPLKMIGDMPWYSTSNARLLHLSTLSNLYEEEGSMQTAMTKSAAIGAKVAYDINNLSQDPEDKGKRDRIFNSYMNMISAFSTDIDNTISDPSVRAAAKLNQALVFSPIFWSIWEGSPAELKQLVTALWGGDQAKGEDIVAGAIDMLTDSAPIDQQSAFEMASWVSLSSKWGKQPSVSQDKPDKLALKAVKAYNAISVVGMKLKAAWFPLPIKVQYVQRKGAGFRPTEIAFKPERESFAKSYRANPDIGPGISTIKPLPVKQSRVIWWRTRVGDVGKAKIYSKVFRF